MIHPTMTCVIDGRCRTKKAVLGRLARDLGFPPHFRANLDALFDVLRTDVRGPVAIVWRRADAARQALGADYAPIARALADVAKARSDVSVIFED